MERLLKNLDI